MHCSSMITTVSLSLGDGTAIMKSLSWTPASLRVALLAFSKLDLLKVSWIWNQTQGFFLPLKGIFQIICSRTDGILYKLVEKYLHKERLSPKIWYAVYSCEPSFGDGGQKINYRIYKVPQAPIIWRRRRVNSNACQQVKQTSGKKWHLFNNNCCDICYDPIVKSKSHWIIIFRRTANSLY